MAPIVPFIPLIAAGVGAATAGVELANQPPTPKAPTSGQTAAAQAQSAEAAAQAEADNLARRRGMASTILTSPLGAGAASTRSATLGA